ncbi:DUF6370 family protein [Aureliella helgolandensis]|uniref:Lipoprotein n=1 Tax=Aureliella helgolandensis TaxID=2527968 RepID=A0A518GBU3_9BACT|nr:DUF6370 family protein [Aureliella helgolandensis]QDV26017.1 hypothetical protein Q31a_43870 [Aureliella helgolandensis]
MKFTALLCVLLLIGCQRSDDLAIDNADADLQVKMIGQVVEASCGECQFDMEGTGCDLAVRIDGKGYFVDGSIMSDHGNAHGDGGMCNTVRKAKVTGEVKGERFVATAFELLPADGDSATHGSSPHDESTHHTH